ncbi:MAG: hypothetical protein ACTSV1_04650 [Alphaproteobacteria bacterium]
MSTAGNKNISKPSQVERARGRLDAAVERLEQVIAESGGKVSSAMEQEVASLKTENERLGKLSGEVTARLDKAIGRLNGVLES